MWPATRGRPLRIDGRVNQFFLNEYQYPEQATAAQQCARSLALFFTFLVRQDRSIRWHHAFPHHVHRWRYRRLYDRNNIVIQNGIATPGTVDERTWNRDLAALQTFYDWAARPQLNKDTGKVYRFIENMDFSHMKEPEPAR